MKLVILSSRFPFPLEKGDKLRLFHQIQGLAEHHEIHLITLSDVQISQEHRSALDEYCESITILHFSIVNSSIHGLRGIFNELPFQVNYFYSGKLKKKIQKTIKIINPDAIYCQLIRMAEYVKDLDFPKVLDYMDAFSLNYTRRIEHETILKRMFFKLESRRLQDYEANVADDFDDLTIISEQDKNKIKTKESIAVISNGLDTEFFKPSLHDKPYQLLFVGNMGYHPNILAAKFIVKKIQELLPSDVKLRIAGARPSNSVKALVSKQVEVTGWIEDIREAYGSAKIFVAPIFSGAGQQNKILEAMSMGLICITSPIVNDAIKAEHEKEILIASKPEDFAKQIKDILENPEKYEKIGLNARKFVKENFSWAKENKMLNDIIINCRKEKRNA